MGCFCTQVRVAVYCRDCGRMAFGKVPTEGVVNTCSHCFSSNVHTDYVKHRNKKCFTTNILSCSIRRVYRKQSTHNIPCSYTDYRDHTPLQGPPEGTNNQYALGNQMCSATMQNNNKPIHEIGMSLPLLAPLHG